MKRIIYCISTFFIICLMIVPLIKAYRYYAPPKERMVYKMEQHDDTLRIAYIGDSWAYMHQKQSQCMIPQMIKTQAQLPARVYSYGLNGRTSKEIYEALFADKRLKKLMSKEGTDYCFISAGINDVNKKLSIGYYQESMDNIIRFLLTNNIRPVILEIPDIDVYKAYRGLKGSRKLLRKLSMAVNNVPMDCKQMYREALDDLIQKKDYQNKVSIIRYKSWNKDYQNDQKRLYLRDGIHLNDYGYRVLDSVIAKEIIKNIENHDHRH